MQNPTPAGMPVQSFWNRLGSYALYIAFVQSIVAFLWSMYYSNIAHFPPCVLCWYQRILMFPLVLILMVGILRKDARVYLYVLPLAWIGWIISLYHNLLYYKIIPDTISPCSTGVSCTTKFIEYFGFVTIPLLAFIAFTVIITMMYVQRRYVRMNETNTVNPA